MMKNSLRRIGVATSAVTVMLAGCGVGGDGAEEAATDAARLSHVHGLGVVDGTVYVATHHGLFTVSADGDAAVVSEDDHDFMGFTVLDDGTFLASGHPGSRTDLPPNLGLLESTDGGETWTEVALMGEVDFHALDASEEAVYGFDSASGQLLASSDRTNWQSLGQIPTADVAISPDDSSVVLITTEAGPQVSRDGGASFDVIPDAPLLVLVDWPRPDQLVGVAPDGTVHGSADGGETWVELGEVGDPPHALTVGPDGGVYVATEHAIARASAGDDTFTVIYEMR